MAKEKVPLDKVAKVVTKKNVVGFSRKPRPKIKRGEETGEEAIRVYVSKKVPKHQLIGRDLIPEEIEGMKTDVVEIGEVVALPVKKKRKWESPTKRFRPVKFGVSVGNLKITAGTLGWLFSYKNDLFFGSNAHVFTPDANMTVDEVMSTERRIIQPGSYDKGTEDDVVALYHWHERVRAMVDRSDCSVSNAVVRVLNFLSELFRRRTRFSAFAPYVNRIDFAVAIPTEEYVTEILNMPEISGLFAGLLFAGSDKSTIVCKAKYIAEKGYRPYDSKVVDVEDGDLLCKAGRTTKYTEFKVIDDSATINVSYGDFIAMFDDVIVGGPGSKGGDSGSSVWLKESQEG